MQSIVLHIVERLAIFVMTSNWHSFVRNALGHYELKSAIISVITKIASHYPIHIARLPLSRDQLCLHF